ncbi:endonuclease [Xenorhabdus beddingii]|uniref:Endonuclease n=1 Tax=Xenorhabdus beddingii TaxID=40578 RepID=A0A1Y2SM33_9GAMM|nr:endonuclease [Xenorhabdus beddingii]
MLSPAKIWEQELLTLHARLAPLFHHTGPQQRSLAYLRGLLSDVERKNSWQLVEWMDGGTYTRWHSVFTGAGRLGYRCSP